MSEDTGTGTQPEMRITSGGKASARGTRSVVQKAGRPGALEGLSCGGAACTTGQAVAAAAGPDESAAGITTTGMVGQACTCAAVAASAADQPDSVSCGLIGSSPAGGGAECALTRSACATSEEPAALQAGKPALGVPGVPDGGSAWSCSVFARAAGSRRLARTDCAAGAEAGKALPSAAWSIPKAEMGVMPSSTTRAARAKLAVLVTAAGAGLCTRADVVDGAEAKAARRLGAMVIVMVFSLSAVNRRQ